MPDHLRGLPPFAIDAFLSPWTMLGAFTEIAPDLKLGVSVTDGIRLHPAILAQNAVSLDHQTNGRFILGIGAGEKMNLSVYGFDQKYAVSRMQESIKVMKRLWTEPSVDHKGRFYHLKNAILEPKPIHQPHPPIWIAGNSPRTRKLTAELAEGWLPIVALPKLYAAGIKEIQTTMKQVGRNLSSFTPGFWGRIFMHTDPERIAQYLFQERRQLVLRPKLLQELGYWRDDYVPIYTEQGLDPNRISLLTYDAHDVARMDTSNFLPMVADIPEEVIFSIALAGTPEQILKKLEAFTRVGVEHFCFEIINGVSRRNAPFTYWDVSRVLAEDIFPQLNQI